MSLRDLKHLQQFCPTQEKLIREHAPLPDSKHAQCEEWEAFRKSIWLKGVDCFEEEEPFDRDEHPLPSSRILPDVLPPSRSIMTAPELLLNAFGIRYQNKLLVRAEYRKAE